MPDNLSSASIQAANGAPSAPTPPKPTLVAAVEADAKNFVERNIVWISVGAVALVFAAFVAAVVL